MAIPKIKHYIAGQWMEGAGDGEVLHHAITGDPVASHTIEGIDFKDAYDHARNVGNPALRKMTFQERGLMLKALAFHLMDEKEKFYEVSKATGATRLDSWIDIEGGIGNVFSNASLRRQFPDLPYHVDGQTVPLSKEGSFVGHHIMVPKEGVAVHINAFNFPIWGMLEKAAVNWLAGMPCIIKPAEQTCYLTEVMVKNIIDSGILPEGALQLVAGYGNGILDHVDMNDVVTFTGSFETGKKLKTLPQIVENSVPFNLEADSLNCAVLGEDAVPGTPEFDLFIKEVRKEITVKCGQKCTAVRRIIVPEKLVEDVQIALGKAFEKTTIGDPSVEGVRMGALAGREQLDEVTKRVAELAKTSDLVYGSLDNKGEAMGADWNKGAFISPMLFVNQNPLNTEEVHNIEAFGPISTILPYKNMDEAIAISKKGKGSLCSSITTANDKIAREYVVGAATHHGRILVLNEACAKESTGHGSPMPQLVHGGPGRAGGGEEMGGKRGVMHYLQRTAIQGSPTTLTEITQQYQYGGEYKDTEKHPFSKHFEDLEIGDTVITAKRTITEGDIVTFANVSWDHFYAHTDVTSLEGTTFEGRVAHGYFILSAAAGLFVQAKKGPVLLNYGLEECRFTKPVYPGMTIGVRCTVKEKVDQEKKDDIAKGIVKFLVDVYDETGETVAIATILTMIKKRDQG
ncbi:oxepin-CoA hydrolase / 3-oxo-5,6-dehydrosuberyl-CoA semialdehyde dehydrogenase [Ekhidna lutea]|uniref:Oxepin-CoA hydrolase / 3-oxo-5,6-dehydrosuberyl-CoA semialdehyde dehydrogenase n=1 Tax=Ekhidna lutea TaxID=447679 RepID=A0A239KMI6_EKHLU|nr:phenylacetic acid degradation bifunctional protein PaaZ [Ekhidna lutea]SNT18789.1 oxepin-CoA hydrolase / 3-oxo-5,6-dehydrosuberyl-CoA semialdehyde dehydrogenase [Ekhidna lutea]